MGLSMSLNDDIEYLDLEYRLCLSPLHDGVVGFFFLHTFVRFELRHAEGNVDFDLEEL